MLCNQTGLKRGQNVDVDGYDWGRKGVRGVQIRGQLSGTDVLC